MSDGSFYALFFIAIVVIIMIINAVSGTQQSQQSPPSQSYHTDVGKPYDMTESQWNKLQNKIRQEYPYSGDRDVENASRAIWEFEKQRRDRDE